MTSLLERAASSAWVGGEPGLADAVGAWSDELARDDPAVHAAAVARVGLLPPLRSLRYLAAFQIANAQRAAGQLSSPGLRPLREPKLMAPDWAILADPELLAFLFADVASPETTEIAGPGPEPAPS